METNLLIAIYNLVTNPILDVVTFYRSNTRVNNLGDSLESYIKDLFCNSVNVLDQDEKNKIYSTYFSYLGNQNNPPDIMIKGGDALEVKKIENLNASIVLNSSYPKDKLYAESPMITKACKECENWRVKDLIYTVGITKNNKLSGLWFVYGDCYSANKEVYERVRDKISKGVNELKEVEFSDTKELGRVNRVDPLGITYLRIRGMWGIDNPIKVFDYVFKDFEHSNFFTRVLMLKEKYYSFKEEDRKRLEALTLQHNIKIVEVKIKSPNNPAALLDAIVINYSI